MRYTKPVIIRNTFLLIVWVVFTSFLNAAAEEPVKIVYNSGVEPAVSDSSPILADILDKGMAQIVDAEIQELKGKWLEIPKAVKPTIPLTPEEQDWLRAHPILRLGIDPSFAPFEFFSQDGQYMGMAADYMKMISERLGIQLIPEKGLKWIEVIEKIKRSELDLLPCVGITEERKQYASYTHAYLHFMRAIITRGDVPVTGIADLAGMNVGVQKNSSHHGFLKEHSKIEPLLYDTFEDALMSLSKNETDTVIGNLAVASHVIRKLTLTNLKIAAYASDEIIPLAIAVRKDLPELVPILNKALASISEEDHLNIRRRWIDVGIMQTEMKQVMMTAEEKAWVKNHPVIRVSSEPDYAPFDFVENGQSVGFSVDYLRLLSERTGLQLQFVQDTWEKLQEMGRQKQIDLLHSIYRTPERMQHFLFTEPYKTVTFAIYVRDDVTEVNTLSDLEGKKIMMVKGDGITDIVSKLLPNAEMIFCNSYTEAVKSLSLGKGDATVQDSAVANYLIRQNTLTNIKPVGEANISGDNKDAGMYRLAIRNDWHLLHTILQKAMDSITPEEFANLEIKWFGKTADKIRLPALTPKEQAFISSHTLVFSEVNWKPLSITDNPEKYDGMIADYFQIITERSGLKFVFRKTESDTWSEVLQNYVDGKIDVVPALGKDDKIGREILLSEPFVSFPLVIVTLSDVSYIRHVSELNGKKVSVGRGYTSFHFLKNHYPNIELVETDNVEQGLIKVSNGDVFAFVDHMAIAVDSLQRLGMKNLKIAGEAGYHFNHRIGVDPKYPEAVSIINKALASITEQEHRDIYRRWLNVKYEKSIDYTLVWQVIATAIIFLIVILYWNWKLAKLNQTLHAEISERVRAEHAVKENEKELVKAKETAEAASKTKSAFLANMSHEIRTPMNSVMGFISVVLDDPILPNKQRKFLSTAYQSSKALLNLINDILDVSKLESGRLELENAPFSLDPVVRETIGTLSIIARGKGLSLEMNMNDSIPRKVVGDPGRLKQILMNLLGNAIKFTKKGYVRLDVSVEKNGKVLFSISDSGIGIASDRLQRIFDPFTQADSSTTRRFGGTGLGTTISKQLVELMGGDIWVESEEGKGSTFYFTIPMKEADMNVEDREQKAEQNPEHHPRQGFKILIAEDIEENIMLAKIRLEQYGHTVIEARNGIEAIEIYEREVPDIILMDVHMPEMDGLEATKAIRKIQTAKCRMQNENEAADTSSIRHSALTHIPIIALTASVMKSEQDSCLKAGMDAVVGKPIDFEELFTAMERLVPAERGRRADGGKKTTGENRKHDIPVIEGVDTKKGLQTWQNAEVYQKALLNFCRDFEPTAEKIRALLENGDRDGAYRIAHTLKGVSGNLSVTEVFHIATRLNSEIKTKPVEELMPVIESLAFKLNGVINSMKLIEHGKEKPEILKQTIDSDQLKKIFTELLTSFDEFNPVVAEPFLEQLNRVLSSEQTEPIRRQLERFVFDGARAETLKLAQKMDITIE